MVQRVCLRCHLRTPHIRYVCLIFVWPVTSLDLAVIKKGPTAPPLKPAPAPSPSPAPPLPAPSPPSGGKSYASAAKASTTSVEGKRGEPAVVSGGGGGESKGTDGVRIAVSDLFASAAAGKLASPAPPKSVTTSGNELGLWMRMS